MGETAELFQRFQQGDDELVELLRAGDHATVARMSSLLRMTPLGRLRRCVGPLVEVLAVLPHLDAPLRHAWWAEDPRFTAQLFAWVARRRRDGLGVA